MNTMRVRCNACDGFGKHNEWIAVSEDRLELKETICKRCEGKGYTEHAIFSVEEAKAILTHCGLIEED